MKIRSKLQNRLHWAGAAVFLLGAMTLGSCFVSAYSSLRPSGAPAGLPVSLKIPTLGVDALVEDAFVTSDGRMDSPKGIDNVAWFALGTHPGEVGSAVIAGHYGIRNGERAVFYDLDKLKKGDKIYVINDKGETLTFAVRTTEVFDRDADTTKVFTSRDGLAHLNIITCEGAWNEDIDTYQNRRVIFTDLLPGDNTAIAGNVAPAENYPGSGIMSGFAPEMKNSYMTSIGTVIVVGLLLISALGVTVKVMMAD